MRIPYYAWSKEKWITEELVKIFPVEWLRSLSQEDLDWLSGIIRDPKCKSFPEKVYQTFKNNRFFGIGKSLMLGEARKETVFYVHNVYWYTGKRFTITNRLLGILNMPVVIRSKKPIINKKEWICCNGASLLVKTPPPLRQLASPLAKKLLCLEQ